MHGNEKIREALAFAIALVSFIGLAEERNFSNSAGGASDPLDVTEVIEGEVNVNVNTDKTSGGGTVIMSGDNTYTGATTVASGTLVAKTLAAVGASSSLGVTGPLNLGPATFRYDGEAAATFGQPVAATTASRASVIDVPSAMLTYNGAGMNFNGSALVKTGEGTLKISGGGNNLGTYYVAKTSTNVIDLTTNGDAPTKGFAAFTVAEGKVLISGGVNTANVAQVGANYGKSLAKAATLEISGGTNWLQSLIYVGCTPNTQDTLSTLRVTGGETDIDDDAYFGPNSPYGIEYWARFEMSGGKLNINKKNSLFLASRDKGHVVADISGGELTIDRNFGCGFNKKAAEGVSEVDVIIRNKGTVSVGYDYKRYFYFYDSNTKSRMSLTVKDGGRLNVPGFCRYGKSTVWPTVLFDGATIYWKYDISSVVDDSGGVVGNPFYTSRYQFAKQIYVGDNGVVLSGGDRSYEYNYTIPFVASNTVETAEPVGITFAKGGHRIYTSLSHRGPITVDNSAHVSFCEGCVLPDALVDVEGTLIVTSSVRQVYALHLGGEVELVNGQPLTIGDGGISGDGKVTLYKDAERSGKVDSAGSYELMRALGTNATTLVDFAKTALSGNNTDTLGAIFETESSGKEVVLYLRLLGASQATPECKALGTNGVGEVTYTFFGETEEVGGKVYVKPGTVGCLRATTTEENVVVGAWRDDSTGEIIYGESAIVSPTDYTTYTALFGKPWFRDMDAKTLYNGDWTFKASASGVALTLRQVQSYPTNRPTCGYLNFATPITNYLGEAYRIVRIGLDDDDDDEAPLYAVTTNKAARLNELFLHKDTAAIGRYGLASLSDVKELDLSRVESMADHACWHPTALERLRLCPRLESVPRYAFTECVNLVTVTPLLPDSVKYVGRAAFYCNDGGKIKGKLTGQSLEQICYSSFYKSKITELELPALTNIGCRAFEGATVAKAVFGKRQLCFADEENSTVKGYGGKSFYWNTEKVRSFYFPGKAPLLAETFPGAHTCCTNMIFGLKSGGVRLYGSWRADPEGWKKILGEVGYRDTSGKEVPGVDPSQGDRRVRGYFQWSLLPSSSTPAYGWLIDRAMPDEPLPTSGIMMTVE